MIGTSNSLRQLTQAFLYIALLQDHDRRAIAGVDSREIEVTERLAGQQQEIDRGWTGG